VTAIRDSRTTLRLGIFVTHPIQYYAPIWRALAATPGLSVTVHFFSDHSVRGSMDRDFGVPVAWDVPLLQGYRSEFITRDADLSAPASVRLPEVRRRITTRNFDAVMIHGYTHRFELQIVRAAHRNGVRTLMRGDFTDVPRMQARSALRGFLREAYLRWFYRHVDAFGCVGNEARQHLLRRGIAEQRLFPAPHSVDTELFEVQRVRFTRAASRSAEQIGDDDLVLLFSGKLIPRKAPLLLLDALRRLPRLDKVVLLMMGDGELRSEVEVAGRALLGDRLRMLGFVNQSQLGRYYAAADVLVLPSHFESWGLVVNEAMQFGLPAIVSSKVACHADLVVEGKTGMVFAQGDAPGLARCLERFVAEPGLAGALGRNARAHIASYSTAATAAGLRAALGLT
jgi:glycosyltransferase involved in cell wall biosynthesis